jgi:hypothetical protein
MAIAWRWVRAVAREHFLDRDARVAGPEQVDEPARADRVGAPAAGRLHRLGLGVGEPVEDAASLLQPGKHRRGRRGAHQ